MTPHGASDAGLLSGLNYHSNLDSAGFRSGGAHRCHLSLTKEATKRNRNRNRPRRFVESKTQARSPTAPPKFAPRAPGTVKAASCCRQAECVWERTDRSGPGGLANCPGPPRRLRVDGGGGGDRHDRFADQRTNVPSPYFLPIHTHDRRRSLRHSRGLDRPIGRRPACPHRDPPGRPPPTSIRCCRRAPVVLRT